MPLESATYIHQLEPSNPPGTDLIAQADDHIRMIKAAVKATFPNITGPVTLTQGAINSPFKLPEGIISIWYGSSVTVPVGWAICDGSTVDRSDGTGTIVTPDLRERTVIGAGTLAAVGEAIGDTDDSTSTSTDGSHSHSVASSGAHDHTGTIGSTALTLAQIPNHRHLNGVVDSADILFTRGGSPAGTNSTSSIDGNSADGTREGYTESVGSGQSHTHSLAISAGGAHTHTTSEVGGHTHTLTVSTMQPSYGLHYIMKI